MLYTAIAIYPSLKLKLDRGRWSNLIAVLVSFYHYFFELLCKIWDLLNEGVRTSIWMSIVSVLNGDAASNSSAVFASPKLLDSVIAGFIAFFAVM